MTLAQRGGHNKSAEVRLKRSLNLILGIALALAAVLAFRWLADRRTPRSDVAVAPSAASITVKPLARATPESPQPGRPLRREVLPRRPGNAPDSTTLEDFLRSQDPTANWKVHRDDEGNVRGFLGGRLPLGGSPAAFLSSLSALLIGQTPEFREAPSASVEGPLARTQVFRQQAAGYEVYGAFARLAVDRGDGSLMELSSDLRPIHRVDTDIGVSLARAEDLVREQYGTRQIVQLIGTNRPLVFGLHADDNYLVLQIHLTLDLPRRSVREILIRARDGKIVRDRSLMRR